MEGLESADLEHVLQFLEELASVEGEEPFPRELLASLRRLVPCDLLAFCELDRHEHPVCRHHEVSGDFSALELSDFMTREHGTEYLMTLGPDSPLSHTKVFLFDRTGGRDFTERDRAVLDLLRPHLARRYAQSRALRRTREMLALLDWSDRAVVLVEDGDQIVFATEHAHDLLVRYFGDSGTRLPNEISIWCSSGSGPDDAPLVVHKDDTLVIRLVGDALVLEEHGRSSRLTTRQQEILDQVAAGRTNAEIAAILCLAQGTVRRHLENIFGKLGVHNRTAAVAALRRESTAS